MVHQSRLIQSPSGLAILGVALLFLLSGCGGVAKGAALQPTPTAPAASATPSAVGYALLLPQPGGPATLTWDPSHSNTLTTSLSLTGLSPASPGSYQSAAYPAAIISGSCREPGKAVHDLKGVTADQYGAATSTTAIPEVAGGIPAKGWNIALYSPGAANQGTLLACAPVLNPNPSTTAKQSVKTLVNNAFPKQGEAGAYGKTQLNLTGTTLTVSLSLIGLTPGSKHAAHLHTGSCAKQGPVVYPLETVTADASGRAQVDTTIKNVKSIPADWFVNVHNSTDLTTQAGFQPIACGDIHTRA
ncbi:MAG TPA: CHRD domain-containing protein [Ktedonobacterales bacterium]|nr:CHRD domain-containing protein [Ktedonobacterales bacterium]